MRQMFFYSELPRAFRVRAKCHILTHQMLTISLVALVHMNLENSYVKLSIS